MEHRLQPVNRVAKRPPDLLFWGGDPSVAALLRIRLREDEDAALTMADFEDEQ